MRLFCPALLAVVLALQPVAPSPAAARTVESWTAGTAAGDPSGITAVHRRGARRATYRFAGPAGTVNDSPALAVDGAGEAAAVWIRRTSGADRVMLTRFDGHTWSEPVPVEGETGRLTGPTAVTGASGLWIAWTRSAGADTQVRVARWDGSLHDGGSFGTAGVPDFDPGLSVDARGRTILSWTGWDGVGYAVFETSFIDGSWSPVSRASARTRLSSAGAPPLTANDRAPFEPGSPIAVALSEGAGAVSTIAPPPEGDGADQPPPPEPLLADAPFDRSYVMGLGDSTTWGRGSSMNGPPTDYLTRLESLLKGPWIGINRGDPGEESTHMLGRVDAELDRYRPGLTILSVGINDAFFARDESVTLFNIQEMAERILARGGKLLLASTSPVMESARALQYDRLRSLNARIAELAAAYDWPFVDWWSVLQSRSDWEERFIDPVTTNHPNNAGYQLMAKRTRGVILSQDLLLGSLSWKAFDPPRAGQTTLEANAGTAVHVDDRFTPLAGPGVSQVAAVDLDGDGIEALGVLATAGEVQTLTFYRTPPAGSFEKTGLLAAVTPLATAEWMSPLDGWVTHLFGIDLDGDGMDEVGLVRFFLKGARQALEIWRAHQPGGAAPERLLLDYYTVPAGGTIRDIAAMQADGEGPDELLVLTEDNLTGRQGIVVYRLPTPGETTPEASVTRAIFSSPAPAKRITQVLGMDVAPEEGRRRDEIVILRSGRMGFYDRLESFRLPDLPAQEGATLSLLSRDRWVRASGPHSFLIEALGLDDGAGGILSTLGVWENR